MQESLYQTADAGDTLSDSRCRSLSIRQMQESLIRQRMQEKLYQIADETSIRQRMQETLYQMQRMQIVFSIRQRMQETLYQTASADDRESSAFAV